MVFEYAGPQRIWVRFECRRIHQSCWFVQSGNGYRSHPSNATEFISGIGFILIPVSSCNRGYRRQVWPNASQHYGNQVMQTHHRLLAWSVIEIKTWLCDCDCWWAYGLVWRMFDWWYGHAQFINMASLHYAKLCYKRAETRGCEVTIVMFQRLLS